VLQQVKDLNVEFGKEPFTSAGRGFGSGYFSYSAPVPRPNHIGARPKEDRFWPRL